jgi:aspartate aminotransferase-like enzyme
MVQDASILFNKIFFVTIASFLLTGKLKFDFSPTSTNESHSETNNELYANAPSPLQEFSVVYTDRALNHMSEPFKHVMTDISSTLKDVYGAHKVAVIPGSGTYGMEAVARQFSPNTKSLVIRNGFFSYRWTQIFETCNIPTEQIVLKARPINPEAASSEMQYQPCPIDEVVATILSEKPGVVYAPHVETSTGIILPNDYLKQVADAVHKVGGLFVLDCIASGTVWVDMKETGVDVIISAPQKGWSGQSSAGLVMLSEKATEVTKTTQSSSFVCNLAKWVEVMESYEGGGFSYYATMPTDALRHFRDAMLETKNFGFKKGTDNAWRLGQLVHKMMCDDMGLVRIAAPGFEAPGVVVVHHHDATVAAKFIANGVQIAAGVPFMVDEPSDTHTFRIGLFGLDKLSDPVKTTNVLRKALVQAVETHQAKL